MKEMELILDEGEGSSMILRDICQGVFWESSGDATKSLTKSESRYDVVSDVVGDVVLCMSIIQGGH